MNQEKINFKACSIANDLRKRFLKLSDIDFKD